ncbi:hypothetical protein CHARACLAT_021398, partial [Characodon lateralis]|nr:hypothetical protein [Characodon lateralis]
EYKKAELSALQCLSVCLCGDFKSKPQSSCNFQPWLKVSALHPANVKVPKLPNSAPVSPLSLAPNHSPSSKLIFISIWCLQPWFHFHYSLLKK